MNKERLQEEFKELILNTFPNKNDWNYCDYQNGLKSVVIDGEGYDLQKIIDLHAKHLDLILLKHDRELKSILEKDLEKYSKQAVDSTDTKNLDEAIGICKYIGEKMKSFTKT